jgi:hypothetical protein
MRIANSSLRNIALLGTVLAVACSDSGPGGVSVAGSWIGSAQFGGTQGVTTRMALVQTGIGISGTIRMTGALPFNGVPITGEVNAANRTMTWIAADGCETYGGVLNIDANGAAMSGPILHDLSGCSSGTNSSGTLTMTKQQ